MANNQPIHIAHIVYSFATGGLENGLVNLINRLPENEYHHSVICITGHDKNFVSRITTNNTKVYDLNKPPGSSPQWLLRCWKLLRKLKPDICHSRNLNPLEAQLAAFFAGIKGRIHGEHGWDVNDLGGVNEKYQKLRRYLKPFIHHYIALSSEAKEYLINKIRVPHQKISQICNGVDITKFSVMQPKTEYPTGFKSENSIIFGTVGRLAKVKNQSFLVKSFIALWQLNPEYRSRVKLIIVGDGELMPELKKLVKEAGAEDAIWLTGLRSDIPELMNLMDVFVLPSLAEGISNTLLEAMACGLPIIATNVGGNKDLIYPEHLQSHLVDVQNIEALRNSMAHYADNADALLKDSTLVRNHCVENFSIDSMVNKYNTLYQNVYRGEFIIKEEK